VSYFDDLVQVRTFAEWQDVVRTSAALVGWNVDALPRRSRLRALMLQVVPDIARAATAAHAPAIRGLFRDLATGGWLKERARQVYNVEPFEETFATVSVTLSNPDAIAYDASAGEIIVRNVVTDETYSNLSPVHLDALGGPQDEVTSDFLARSSGTIANAEDGEISAMVSGGFGGVTVTNLSPARASDEEPEASIRDRMRLALASFTGAAPGDFYEYVAKSAIRLADGTYALQRAETPVPAGAASLGITRVQVLEDDPEIGDVSVYLADDDGPTPLLDADGVDGLILLHVRPTGVNYLGSFPAIAVAVAVTYTVTVRASDGFTSSEIQAMIATSLGALFTSTRDAPIGGVNGFFYRAALIDAIRSAQPAGAEVDDPFPIVDVPSLVPAGNVAIGPGEFPQLGAITATVNFI
jgi:hypothetical protein